MHLYLGLFGGAVLVVVGLTGSLLAFSAEADRWFMADLLTVSPRPARAMAYRSIDELFLVLKGGHAFQWYRKAPQFPARR